jgi:bla regulator protein blaR1
MYKRSIRLNHEFLADESVLSALPDASKYQLLLLNKIDGSYPVSLSSQFNYLITKKRLIMMTRTTTPTRAIVKQTAAMLLIAVAVFLFATRTVAQEIPKVLSLGRETGSTKEGVPAALLKEYDGIITKYKNKIPQSTWWNFFGRMVSEEDRNRMETIFNQMSKDQQQKQIVFFRAPLPPMQKVTPKVDDYESWKDAKVYGVWIDNKRVANEELNKYTNTSFAHVFVSRLSQNAINYGKHYYQVDLMTREYYEQYYQKAISNTKSIMMFRVRPEVITKVNDIFALQEVAGGC